MTRRPTPAIWRARLSRPRREEPRYRRWSQAALTAGAWDSAQVHPRPLTSGAGTAGGACGSGCSPPGGRQISSCGPRTRRRSGYVPRLAPVNVYRARLATVETRGPGAGAPAKEPQPPGEQSPPRCLAFRGAGSRAVPPGRHPGSCAGTGAGASGGRRSRLFIGRCYRLPANRRFEP